MMFFASQPNKLFRIMKLPTIEIDKSPHIAIAEVETRALLFMDITYKFRGCMSASENIWALALSVHIEEEKKQPPEEKILSVGFQYKTRAGMWSENQVVRKMVFHGKSTRLIWIRRSDGMDVCSFLDRIRPSAKIAIVPRKGRGSEIKVVSTIMGVYLC